MVIFQRTYSLNRNYENMMQLKLELQQLYEAGISHTYFKYGLHGKNCIPFYNGYGNEPVAYMYGDSAVLLSDILLDNLSSNDDKKVHFGIGYIINIVNDMM